MERNQLVTRSMDYLIGAPSVSPAALPANRRKLMIVAASVHLDQMPHDRPNRVSFRPESCAAGHDEFGA